MSTSDFTGFPREGLTFLEGLAQNNAKGWLDAHRGTYETALLEPAKTFVTALGGELRSRISPALRAEPRVNGSILRINRDIRFSPDKRPYKDHLDLMFWEGDGHSRESPGFFVRLRPRSVLLGAGMHRFQRDALRAYRAAVLDEHAGTELQDAIARATAPPGVSLGAATYKRVPPGIAPDHPRADLLLQGGLFVVGEWEMPAVVSEPGFVAWAADRLEAMAPVERWLTNALVARQG